MVAVSAKSNSRLALGALFLSVFAEMLCASAFSPHNSSPLRPSSASLGTKKCRSVESRRTAAPPISSSSLAMSKESDDVAWRGKSRMVWLTGHEDLRLRDHGGFAGALSKATAVDDDDDRGRVIPVFVLDEGMHLRSRSASSLERLRACLESLEAEISRVSSSSTSLLSPLVVRTGSPCSVLPALAKEVDAASCHVIADDVVGATREAQRSARAALEEADVEVARWTNCLRPSAPWSFDESTTATNGDGSQPELRKRAALPSFYPDYREIADALPVAVPKGDGAMIVDDVRLNGNAAKEQGGITILSEGIPSLSELLDMAESATPGAVLEARSSRQRYRATDEPYQNMVSEKWCTERGAMDALEEYCRIGNDEFTNKYFTPSEVAKDGASSMYAASVARLVKSSPASPNDVLALREGPTRALTAALGLGAIGARMTANGARNRRRFPSSEEFWGRSSEGALSDVVEWREWFRLLAERSLALQEAGEPGISGGERANAKNENNEEKDGDSREGGTVHYWRWKDQYLVRYLTFPAGEDYDAREEGSRAPALLLVHGFAASAEQWERLVHGLRKKTKQTNGGMDTTPPIYAVDLLGFGHSEKPGLSYTQYLWESQLVDFAIEVMEAVPMVMVGNSIGGGLAAGAAASLGKKICRGLVLLNTAGILLDPDTYDGYKVNSGDNGDAEVDGSIDSHTEAAIQGNPNEAYKPVPLIGNKALDVFGSAIVGLIYPQIEKRLSLIYGNRIENADPSVVYAIQQSASSPGSANVVGSGQKLAPNRPLNEVLMGVGEEEGEDGESGGEFPTLVVMGLEDRVSSPEVARTRAELFSRLSPETVTVEAIPDSGHCPHDETPEKVADAMLKWFESPLLLDSSPARSTGEATMVTQ